jgi:hypothetical protein
LSGTSGVIAYELGDDSITLKFVDGSTYLYNQHKPGSQHVKSMRALAVAGRGLATYINVHVRGEYAARLA